MKYSSRCVADINVNTSELEALTSLRSWSHSWQLSSLSSRPSYGTFYRCTFSECSYPSPGISHKTPLCGKDKYKWTWGQRNLSLSAFVNTATWMYSRFDNLSQVILVGHLWGIVIILLLSECQTTKWHGSACPRGRECPATKQPGTHSTMVS